MIVRSGVWEEVEGVADFYIFDLYPLAHGIPTGTHRRNYGRGEENFVMSPWQDYSRHHTEVYFLDGIPDEAVRPGIFHRAYNPLVDLVSHYGSTASIHHRVSVPYGGGFGFSSYGSLGPQTRRQRS